MTIHILVESSFKDSIWCRQLLRSLSEEAAIKRYETNVIPSDFYTDIDFDSLFSDADERRILFCICPSIKAVSRITESLATKKIHTILLNHFFSSQIENYSSICMDFSGAIKKIIRYLLAAGKQRIALYGINPNSATDLIKKINFLNYMKLIDPSYDESFIFYNNASLIDCYNDFYPRRKNFDAIVCANDVVAISLLNNLKVSGEKVPDNYYIVSFGDTVLSKVYSPSITNASVNLWEIGRQAVHLYSYLRKQESYVSASIMVRSEIFVRDSTAHFSMNEEDCIPISAPLLSKEKQAETDTLTDTAMHLFTDNTSFYHNINFYDDPCAAEILKVEDLLYCLNEFDFAILSSLLNAEPIAAIAEKLYTSQQSISYRIKRMCQVTGCKNRTHLLELLTKYISYESIAAYQPNNDLRI